MNVMVPVVEGKGTLFEDAGFEVKSADEITCNQIDTSESIMSALAHTTIESAKLSNSDKAISMVAEDGREEELRSFLESDLSLVENVKDWAGDGLLSLAAWHDRPNIVRMLLYDFKANVHAKNFTKTTALHRASACGSLNCAAILLEKGADAEVCDSAGRTPVDTCSTVAIREFLKERIRDDKETIRQLHLSIAKADIEFEEKRQQVLEADHARRIASRLNQAVPIIFIGASNEEINGAYDPIYELHDEWPIYRKRDCKIGKTEVILMYEARESAWTIKIVSLEQVQSQDTLFDNQGSPGRQGKRLVKLVSAVASFPELRLEGCNGITESGARGAESEISIIPESEFNGALEMEKLRRLDFSPSLRGLL